MTENPINTLRTLFGKLVRVYEKDEDKKVTGLLVRETGLERDEFKESPNDEAQLSVGKLLPEMLKCLEELGYDKKSVAFAVDVEMLTVERWGMGGKGVKLATLKKFKEFIEGILDGRSQLSLKAADSGFVTWRYLIEDQQAKSDRIWYISSSRFLLARSLDYKDAVKNLFLKERQEKENRNAPVMVYLYPRYSETDNSLVAWTRSLENISRLEPLCGTIIGIVDDSLNWFLPGVRAVMLEKSNTEKSERLEGYIRVQLAAAAKEQLLKALDPKEKSPHTPWLTVANDTVSRWYFHCEEHYIGIVEDCLAKKNTDFAIYRVDMDEIKLTRQESSVPLKIITYPQENSA